MSQVIPILHLFITLVIIKMVERNTTMTLYNWGDFHNADDFDESNVTSSFVLLRLIAEWGTKAPGVLKG